MGSHRTNAARVQHEAAGRSDFLRFFVTQRTQQACAAGDDARIGAEHARHIGPDFKTDRIQLRGQVRGRRVGAAAPEQHAFTCRVTGNEALRQNNAVAVGQLRLRLESSSVVKITAGRQVSRSFVLMRHVDAPAGCPWHRATSTSRPCVSQPGCTERRRHQFAERHDFDVHARTDFADQPDAGQQLLQFLRNGMRAMHGRRVRVDSASARCRFDDGRHIPADNRRRRRPRAPACRRLETVGQRRMHDDRPVARLQPFPDQPGDRLPQRSADDTLVPPNFMHEPALTVGGGRHCRELGKDVCTNRIHVAMLSGPVMAGSMPSDYMYKKARFGGIRCGLADCVVVWRDLLHRYKRDHFTTHATKLRKTLAGLRFIVSGLSDAAIIMRESRPNAPSKSSEIGPRHDQSFVVTAPSKRN